MWDIALGMVRNIPSALDRKDAMSTFNILLFSTIFDEVINIRIIQHFGNNSHSVFHVIPVQDLQPDATFTHHHYSETSLQTSNTHY